MKAAMISVAKVNAATGEVTIVGVGTAVIAATAAGSDNYDEASASYTLTVFRRASAPSATTPDPEPEPDDGLPFTDVPKSAYYYDAVDWAVGKEITDGVSATQFAPNATCTRSQKRKRSCTAPSARRSRAARASRMFPRTRSTLTPSTGR